MQAIEKIVQTNNWITLLLLMLFVSIVLLKLLDTKRLKESFFIFFNFSLIEEDDIESSTFFDAFQVVIFLFSVAVFSILALQFKVFKFPETAMSFSSFAQVFMSLVSFFLLKRMLEYTLALLFLIKNGVLFFLISKNNYLYAVSFLLYIAIVLTEYSNLNQLFVFYFAVFLFLTRFVYYVVRNKKLIFNKLFYFILYICAFEIAPLFILFKLIF